MNNNVISIVGVLSVFALYMYINYRFKDVADHTAITADHIKHLQRTNDPNLYDIVMDEAEKCRKLRIELEKSIQETKTLSDDLRTLIATSKAELMAVKKTKNPDDFLAMFGAKKPNLSLSHTTAAAAPAVPTASPVPDQGQGQDQVIEDAITAGVECVAAAFTQTDTPGTSPDRDQDQDDDIFRSDSDPGFTDDE